MKHLIAARAIVSEEERHKAACIGKEEVHQRARLQTMVESEGITCHEESRESHCKVPDKQHRLKHVSVYT